MPLPPDDRGDDVADIDGYEPHEQPILKSAPAKIAERVASRAALTVSFVAPESEWAAATGIRLTEDEDRVLARRSRRERAHIAAAMYRRHLSAASSWEAILEEELAAEEAQDAESAAGER